MCVCVCVCENITSYPSGLKARINEPDEKKWNLKFKKKAIKAISSLFTLFQKFTKVSISPEDNDNFMQFSPMRSHENTLF